MRDVRMTAANGLCLPRPFSSDIYDFGSILSIAVRCTCASSHSIRMPDAALFRHRVPGRFARCCRCIGLRLADGARDEKSRSRRQRLGPDQAVRVRQTPANGDYGISPSRPYFESSAASRRLSRPDRNLPDVRKSLFIVNYCEFTDLSAVRSNRADGRRGDIIPSSSVSS
jgi:hypothetical protein